MKLSDVRGERCIEVVADLIDPISRIAEDERAIELFKPQRLPDGEIPSKFMAKRLKRGLPALLRDHKGDVMEILATVEGVSVKEYAKTLTLAKLISDATELLTDKDTISFFFSPTTTGGDSGEASASTEGQRE